MWCSLNCLLYSAMVISLEKYILEMMDSIILS